MHPQQPLCAGPELGAGGRGGEQEDGPSPEAPSGCVSAFPAARLPMLCLLPGIPSLRVSTHPSLAPSDGRGSPDTGPSPPNPLPWCSAQGLVPSAGWGGRVRGSRPKEPGWPARPPDKAPWTPTLKMRCRGRSLISEHHLERHVDPKGQQCKAATSKALAKEEMRRQGHLPQKHPPCSPKLLYT